MKQYSFDKNIDRNHSNCLKYDSAKEEFGTTDIMPMWIADMDFATPDFILEAIRKRTEHEVLGYSLIPEGWSKAIHSWLQKRYQWNVSPKEMGFVPGIVAGIAFLIQCFTKPGEKVLIQSPVYPPFHNVPTKNGRKLVINPLLYKNGQWEIDFEDFEVKAASGCKMFILCSPHNPGGRIWTKEELLKMISICEKYGIIIVSDEIHADLALPGHTHATLGSLSSKKQEKIITLMAPSKTFNMPGLSSSFYVIQNQELLTKFQRFMDNAELSHGNIFAFTAAQAAYENGEDWLRQSMEYIQGNIDFVDQFLKKNIPQIKECVPQASFLVWLDCRDLKMSPKDLQNFFITKAKLGLNAGNSFGKGGEGFMRMNVGCTRDSLQKAMNQLKTAVDELFS
ncbi:MAG: PatB family C-S lyase [Bacteroidales bacterium]|nr:PatB family C-S lyase [Bacteroidales bacterium]